MRYRKLGLTEVDVSVFALGTMTFGQQNNAAEAHAQLDHALEAGINLIDTAEMYPSPPSEETYGLTERIVGEWLARRGARERVVLATKAAGPAAFVPWIRGGTSRHDEDNLAAALDASLERLQTDYIDLYQLHWPDRAANFFGPLGFKAAQSEPPFSIERTLRTVETLVAMGKIRYLGLSNETPWGVMEFLRLARAHDLTRAVAIQNPYNLLNRSFEIGLAEIAHRERCGLLAYSPLAFGTLTGKYLDPARAGRARLDRYAHFKRYSGARAERAVRAYVGVAAAAGLDAAHMALAYVASKPFVTSVIIGATSVTQLEHNLVAADIVLDKQVEKAIEAAHEDNSNPCP